MATAGAGTTFSFVHEAKATRGEALVVPLFADARPTKSELAALDGLTDGAVSRGLALGALGDDAGAVTASFADGAYPRWVLVSLGPRNKYSIASLRRAATAAAGWLINAKLSKAAVWSAKLPSGDIQSPLAEWACAMQVRGYRFEVFRSDSGIYPRRIKINMLGGDARQSRAATAEGVEIADALNFTRTLGHRPPNDLHPTALAAEAQHFARRLPKVTCKVLRAAELRKLKMNGLLAVGGGAAEAPCLILLEYKGAAKSAKQPTTALVGKAVTFDTGGYSLKPRDGMDGMKFDMLGGATVFGAIQAAARLKLRCNLIGIVPTAENAVSAQAYRVNDILRMASGKTVEVNNTDAEGRLILADALWYAQRRCKVDRIIDFATLTGGAVISLGRAAACLMGNNDELLEQICAAGKRVHERVWPLPLWDDYRELIKGRDSDIRNSATKREAHAIVGGMFLREFVDDANPWAHIDIAGVAATDDGGATGFGVRLMVDFLRASGA